jgi:hypothetical protein
MGLRMVEVKGLRGEPATNHLIKVDHFPHNRRNTWNPS